MSCPVVVPDTNVGTVNSDGSYYAWKSKSNSYASKYCFGDAWVEPVVSSTGSNCTLSTTAKEQLFKCVPNIGQTNKLYSQPDPKLIAATAPVSYMKGANYPSKGCPLATQQINPMGPKWSLNDGTYLWECI